LAKRPPKREYPKQLVTLGDHIRKRRLDLGLFQKDVAVTIGVDTMTICNWEKNQGAAQFRFIPRIISFLGYVPSVIMGNTSGEKIKRYRYVNGLSQRELARQIGIDPGTLSRVERGRGRCLPSVLRIVMAFIGDASDR
jgi:transcriptional regulator with XRE-family HTH domain